MNNQPRASFNDLPQELVDRILSYLTPQNRSFQNLRQGAPTDDRLYLRNQAGYYHHRPPIPIIFTSRQFRQGLERPFYLQNNFTVYVPPAESQDVAAWLGGLVRRFGTRPFGTLTVEFYENVAPRDFHYLINLAELTRATGFEYNHATVRFQFQARLRPSIGGLEGHLLEVMDLGRRGRDEGWTPQRLATQFFAWAGPRVHAALQLEHAHFERREREHRARNQQRAEQERRNTAALRERQRAEMREWRAAEAEEAERWAAENPQEAAELERRRAERRDARNATREREGREEERRAADERSRREEMVRQREERSAARAAGGKKKRE